MRIDPIGYALVGAAYDVYNRMGTGFLEEVYRECLQIELGRKEMRFQREVEIPLYYDGIKLKKRYRVDLLVDEKVLVELKAVSKILPEHVAQLMNYLHAMRVPVGYLINFGKTDELEWKRVNISLKLQQYDKRQ